jgi:hypothetical protein
VSGTAAKRLRPGQSLIADLGLDEVDLEVLAGCQCRLGDRLRQDRATTRIGSDDLRDATVADVIALTLRRALGRRVDPAELRTVIARTQAGLRGAEPPASDTPLRGGGG